jgi:hypothetical protein
MSARMRSDPLFRLLFVLYCVEAGVFLVLAPWSPVWSTTVTQLALSPAFQGLFLHPLVRGAVSGFGLVHLVWGVHDLRILFPFRKRA